MRNYRGKPVDKSVEWVYGWYFEIDGKSYIIPSNTNKCDGAGALCSYCEIGLIGFVEVIPSTVGQATGLKDKNGKEAYHHDKIQLWVGAPWNEEEIICVKGKIIWQDSGWWFDCKGGEYSGHLAYMGSFEIVSSIHDEGE